MALTGLLGSKAIIAEYPSPGVLVLKMAADGKQTGRPQHGRRESASKVTSIVRVAGKDVDGSLDILRALSKVKGIGNNFAHALTLKIEKELKIPKSTEIGSLDEKQVEAVEGIIKDPLAVGIPTYCINKNKDTETGKNVHNVGNDLLFSTRQDISRDVSMKAWRGYRHQYGQKVRGQHTRSTGRTGITVGVTKKSAQMTKAGAATAAAAAQEKKK